MDELTRLQSDVTQLTKRVDDFSMRLAVVEITQKGFDEKLDEIKDTLKWVSRWLAGLVFGSLVLALLTFIYRGGIAALT